MKVCTKCSEPKPIEAFNKNRNFCKQCQALLKKEWYNKNKDYCLSYNKKYVAENADVVKGKKKKYNKENREKISEYNRRKYIEKVDYNRNRAASFYSKNKNVIAKKKKADRENNPEKYKGYQKKRVVEGKTAAYLRKRRREDIEFRLACAIRRRVNRALAAKKQNSRSSATKALGCSYEFFKNYLQAKFDSKMNWGNYGSYWHVDHILPLSKFDLTNPEEFARACHYTNMQPLEAIENIKKSNKIISHG